MPWSWSSRPSCSRASRRGLNYTGRWRPGPMSRAPGRDIARGETLLRRGRVLTAREIGMLAAVGMAEVPVWRRPRVAILSTGDEIVAPGAPIRPGQVYDSNAAILAASVEEMRRRAGAARHRAGRPGGTGGGAGRGRWTKATWCCCRAAPPRAPGDLAHQAVRALSAPGVIVHGVALKPGKPLCLAVAGRQAWRWCCRGFRPRRSSPSTASLRR